MPSDDTYPNGPAAGLIPRVTPAQIIACGIVAASIGWSFWLLRDRPLSDEVELLPGTVLPYAEMAVVEAALDKAQLTDHRTDDGRIWVPRSRHGTYQRALVDAQALPQRFGSSLHKALDRTSPWQSTRSQQQAYRVAIQDELKQVICAMPGIEDASVLYDAEERPAFDGGIAAGTTRTASVNVRTKPDAELEPQRVQAIRVLVASSIAGLSADRVAVIDLRAGQHHDGPIAAAADEGAEGPAADPELARRMAHEKHLSTKVRRAIGFVKGAIVNVTVSFAAPTPSPAPAPAPDRVEPATPARSRSVAAANEPAEVGPVRAGRAAPGPQPATVAPPSAPHAVVVAIAIPDDHFQDELRIALARDPRADPAASERQAEERIRGIVRPLLPPELSADRCRIAVTRIPAVGTAAGRRDVGTARAVALRPVTAAPQTPGQFIDATWVAVAGGRPGDVPREAWLVAIALCAMLLAWLVLRAGGRPAQPRRGDKVRRQPATRIDWARLDAGRQGGDDAGAVDVPTRTAA
jgi:type III secretory pathway lipoprotein EscJ